MYFMVEKINEIVEKIREISKSDLIKSHDVLFVKNEFGIREGYIKVDDLLHYIADMLEE